MVVSLDFEMMWGCHDWATAEGYGASHVRQVPEVIDRLLEQFEKHGVHATFATVGLIMCQDKEEALASAPAELPSYDNPNMSTYKEGGEMIGSISDENAGLYFAPEMVSKISGTPGMEVGTHTFGHYFCWERGQTPRQFEADLERALEVGNKNGVKLRSVVFPKNNVSGEYLRVAAGCGLKVYRGVARHFFDEPKNRVSDLVQRVARLADAYLPVVNNIYPVGEIKQVEGVCNVAASRFLRPYSRGLRMMEPLRLRRMRGEMIKAAKRGEVYHLWWHPHNFGANMEENFGVLEALLDTFDMCHERYGMQSVNMGEMASLANGN